MENKNSPAIRSKRLVWSFIADHAYIEKNEFRQIHPWLFAGHTNAHCPEVVSEFLETPDR